MRAGAAAGDGQLAAAALADELVSELLAHLEPGGSGDELPRAAQRIAARARILAAVREQCGADALQLYLAPALSLTCCTMGCSSAISLHKYLLSAEQLPYCHLEVMSHAPCRLQKMPSKSFHTFTAVSSSAPSPCC